MSMPGLKAHLKASLLEGTNLIPLYISLDGPPYPGYLLLFISLSNQDANSFILPLEDPLLALPLLSMSSAFPYRRETKAKEKQ